MPGTVNFSLDGEPESKERPRGQVRYGKGGKPYCAMHTSEATELAEEAVGRAFQSANPGWDALPAGSIIHVWVIFSEGKRHRGHWRDIDNMEKLVMDALNGVAWHDDRDVVSVAAEVRRGSDVPHTWVAITWE